MDEIIKFIESDLIYDQIMDKIHLKFIHRVFPILTDV